MSAKTNLYGDNLSGIHGQYGSNISAQRVDDLDRAAIAEAYNGGNGNNRGTVVDLGCGMGHQTLRLALSGRPTLGIDMNDESLRFKKWSENTPGLQLSFLQMDIRQLTQANLPPDLEIACTQRTLSFLTYQEQQNVLRLIFDRLESGGKLFASSGGLEAEYKDAYAHRDLQPEQRFTVLDAPIAQKHGITLPICILWPTEFGQLAESVGFRIEKVWASPFGNNKGIFIKN